MSVGAQDDSASSTQALLQCLKQININAGEPSDNDMLIPIIVAISKVHDHMRSLPRPISSADIPYRLIRDAVFDLVQRSSASNPLEVVSACHLYLDLIKFVPIAYDEAAFTAVVHLMTTFLKRAHSSPSEGRVASAKKKQVNSNTSYSRSLLSCWKVLVELTSLPTFAQNFSVVGQVTANGFAQLLLRASTSTERNVSTSGLKLVTRVNTGNAPGTHFSYIYKALMPVTLTRLLAPAKADLINLLLTVGAQEKEAMATGARLKDTASEEGQDAQSHVDKTTEEWAKGAAAEGVETEEDERETASTAQRTNSRSPKINLQFIGFLYYCCANIPEKSDDRKTVFDVVTRCMESLDSDAKSSFVGTFPLLAQHPRSTVRVFISNICAKALVSSKDCERAEKNVLATVSSVLCGRIRDKIPAVRAKALSSLGTILCELDFTKTKELILSLCLEKSYLETLARDEKVSVRKSYIHLAGALVRAMLMHGCNKPSAPTSQAALAANSTDEVCKPAIIHDWIETIRIRSSDSMSSVRKAVLLELTKTGRHLMTRNSPQVQKAITKAWTSGVLRRIEDDDVSCQQASIDSFSEIVIESVEEEGNANLPSKWEDEKLRTEFLDFVLTLAGDEASSISGYVRTIMGRTSKQVALRASFLKALEARILEDRTDVQDLTSNSFGTVNPEMMRNGTWALFAECLNSNTTAGSRKKLRVAKLYKVAQAECSQSSGQVAAFFSEDLTLKDQGNSVASLIEKLFRKKEWSATFWRKSVRAIVQTIAGVDNLSGSLVLAHCESELDLLEDSATAVHHLSLLAIIGECFSTLQLSEIPPQPLLNFVLSMANTSQPSTAVRASAVLTLGKVCLAEGTSFTSKSKPKILGKPAANTVNAHFFENFARSSLPVFIRELQDDTAIPVRNNSVLVLSDLCRRYTSVVEPYQTRIAARLADPSELIRCHVLGSIGSLLQEDYIKVRSGAVFFRLALSLLDDSEQVRSLAKYIITRILHPKSHTLLSTSIIELVFVLNGCTASKKYNQFPELHIGLKSYTHRPGAGLRKHYPYEVFLNTMSEDQVLVLSSRICSEILTPIVDGKISFHNEQTKGVLFDALAILEMIEKCQSRPSETSDGIGEHPVSAVTNESGGQTAKAALIRKVRMAELKVSLVPLMLELRGILEAERSPILEALTNTLCCILKPHRKNLQELVSDPTVLSELAHQLTKQQKLGGQTDVHTSQADSDSSTPRVDRPRRSQRLSGNTAIPSKLVESTNSMRQGEHSSQLLEMVDRKETR